jgi:hypothetical protein
MSAAGPLPRRSLPLGGTARGAKGVSVGAAGLLPRRWLPEGHEGAPSWRSGTARSAKGAP